MISRFQFLDAVFLIKHICVHSVHRYVVVVSSLLVKSISVELQVVTLKDLVLVKWKRVLDSNVLDVLVGLLLGNLLKFRVLVEYGVVVDVHLSVVV